MRSPSQTPRVCAVLMALLCLAVAIPTPGAAQPAARPYYVIGAGYARPVGPEHFYDYWKDGFTVCAAYGTPLRTDVVLQIGADVSRFGVEAERVMKGVGVSPTESSIDGGDATVVMISGAVRYFPESKQSVPLYVLGGLSMAFSHIAEARALYSGLEVVQKPETNHGLLAALGGGLRLAGGESGGLFLEGRVHFPIFRSERANDNYSSVRILWQGML